MFLTHSVFFSMALAALADSIDSSWMAKNYKSTAATPTIMDSNSIWFNASYHCHALYYIFSAALNSIMFRLISDSGF